MSNLQEAKMKNTSKCFYDFINVSSETLMNKEFKANCNINFIKT